MFTKHLPCGRHGVIFSLFGRSFEDYEMPFVKCYLQLGTLTKKVKLNIQFSLEWWSEIMICAVHGGTYL